CRSSATTVGTPARPSSRRRWRHWRPEPDGHRHLLAAAVSELVGLALVSLSVGLSNFAGSIGIGLSGVDARTRLRVGVAFGLFEGLMPVLGLLIGQALAGSLGHWGRYLGAGLLVLTGVYTIWQARQTEHEELAGALE